MTSNTLLAMLIIAFGILGVYKLISLLIKEYRRDTLDGIIFEDDEETICEKARLEFPGYGAANYDKRYAYIVGAMAYMETISNRINHE